MSEIKEFISVSEAVRLSFKPEVTIRRLIKRLSNDIQTQSYVTVTDTNNSKPLYQIDRNYLIKLYNLDDNHMTVNRHVSKAGILGLMNAPCEPRTNYLSSRILPLPPSLKPAPPSAKLHLPGAASGSSRAWGPGPPPA